MTPKFPPKTSKNFAHNNQKKTPKTFSSQSSDLEMFSINFSYIDLGNHSDWQWPSEANGWHEIVDFLREMSRLNWREIRQLQTPAKGNKTSKRYHPHDFSTLPVIVQKYIESHHLDMAFDFISRFRVGSTKRLWGFESGKTFYPLWWDPDHKVYPIDI